MFLLHILSMTAVLSDSVALVFISSHCHTINYRQCQENQVQTLSEVTLSHWQHTTGSCSCEISPTGNDPFSVGAAWRLGIVCRGNDKNIMNTPTFLPWILWTSTGSIHTLAQSDIAETVHEGLECKLVLMSFPSDSEICKVFELQCTCENSFSACCREPVNEGKCLQVSLHLVFLPACDTFTALSESSFWFSTFS